MGHVSWRWANGRNSRLRQIPVERVQILGEADAPIEIRFDTNEISRMLIGSGLTEA